MISWTAMIGAYPKSGDGNEAFRLFLQMQQQGMKPDAVTYMSLLNPNASVGSVEWVKEVRRQAVKSGLD